jgi:hypothetical protein
MVMIIEFVPGFGRIEANRENAGSPKRLEVVFLTAKFTKERQRSPREKYQRCGIFVE